MSDTTTPPEPVVEPEMPKENQGAPSPKRLWRVGDKSRIWLYFVTGLIFLLLIIDRQPDRDTSATGGSNATGFHHAGR